MRSYFAVLLEDSIVITSGEEYGGKNFRRRKIAGFSRIDRHQCAIRDSKSSIIDRLSPLDRSVSFSARQIEKQSLIRSHEE